MLSRIATRRIGARTLVASARSAGAALNAVRPSAAAALATNDALTSSFASVRSSDPRWFSSTATPAGDGDGDGEDGVAAVPDVPPAEEGGDDTSAAEAAPAAVPESELKKNMKPSDIVAELDRHIIGQTDAKKAVAIAMRNRWRRRQLPEELRSEVTPRNVLLIGPTGCGKTEVARRMAMMNDAPFLKVEATKFTEVGYHGRDVDQIVRDLTEVSVKMAKQRHMDLHRDQAKALTEERILDILAGPTSNSAARGRESFRDMLRQGLLDDQEIEIDVPNNRDRNQNDVSDSSSNSNNPQVVGLNVLIQQISQGGRKQTTERKKLPISEARKIIMEVELQRLTKSIDFVKAAVDAVEESGIVFIDEIDKICSGQSGFASRSPDASAEGVQRDLLPLIEGTTIDTKHGNVKTDYILFIASGSFHSIKVSDMLPELQGRLPIRVELKGLTEDDLYKILTEPVANLVHQQKELIGTEGVKLVFEDEAIREIARMAAHLNKTVENIGARQLHAVMERIMENISLDAAELDEGSVVVVNKATVEDRLKDVTMQADLSRYIL